MNLTLPAGENHRANPDVERFFAGKIFGEECFALGFDMDCGQSLQRAVPEAPHILTDSRALAHHVAKLDVQTLGNAIFSRWRAWTYWDQCSLDEEDWAWFGVALKRLAAITEAE